MALQSSGEITLQDIAFEFDDAAPHQLSEFYGAASGIPTSGEITISDFYGATASFYNGVIDGSARFDASSSAYLYRTPSSAGNRQTWTFSTWVKKGSNLGNSSVFMANPASSNWDQIVFHQSNDKIYVGYDRGGSNYSFFVTDAVFRDPSAWYHLVVVSDTTNATQNDRVKIYVNGERQSTSILSGYGGFSQNFSWNFNNTVQHRVGSFNDGGTAHYLNGYQAETIMVSGTALAPTSFGETKNGVWIPKAYSGSYGTTGFRLDFGTSLTADQSGNGNNFTANNMGSTDLMLDTPENNFCTLTPLAKDSSVSLAEGNLKYTMGGAGDWEDLVAGVGAFSGKWYWEARVHNGSSGTIALGVAKADKLGLAIPSTGGSDHLSNNGSFYRSNGTKLENGSYGSSFGTSYGVGDVIGMAWNADSSSITFYKNGTSQGTLTLTSNTDYIPAFHGYNSGTGCNVNFGQDSTFAGATTAGGNADGNGYGDFKYSVPSGYLALCTANLPVATAVDPFAGNSPQDHFNTVLYTGNGTTNDINTVGFEPAFTWIKGRSASHAHGFFDQVRGARKVLWSNSSDDEYENASGTSLVSWDSAGFNLGSDGAGSPTNSNGTTYVAWNWKGNGSGSSNTDGSITSTVSANTGAGFSIATWTGNGSAGSTIGHGLNSAPDMFIIKRRNANGWSWLVMGNNVGTPSNGDFLYLNSTAAINTGNASLNTTLGSSTITLDYNTDYNANGGTYVGYFFHSVEGFSKFGTYNGNGADDGTFVYTGFRPAFVLVKVADAAGDSWRIYDSPRNPYNGLSNALFPNLSNAESTAELMPDFLSNGFKLRSASGSYNGSGETIIYMAFAEQPFAFANAR